MLDHDESNLADELKERFGLSEDPFSARVSAFYDGAQRRHNLETLRHLSIFGDMVLLLTGDHGTGKTTLVEQFSKAYSDEVQVISLSAGSGSERIHSVIRLAAISGLEVSPKEPHRDVLEHLVDLYTESFERNGKRTLIILDDAHALPTSELNLYLEIMSALDAESGAALLLVGLPSLTASAMAYEHPDRQEWLHQVQLKPLNTVEVDEYLRCRLEAVGYLGEAVLSEADLTRLVSLAQGVPGSINAYFPLVALGLAGGEDVRAKSSSSSVPQAALFAIALLLAVSFAFVSYQHGFFDFDGSGFGGDPVVAESDLESLRAKEARLNSLERAIEQSSMNKAQIDPSQVEVASLQGSANEPDPVKGIASEKEVLSAQVSLAPSVVSEMHLVSKPQQIGGGIESEAENEPENESEREIENSESSRVLKEAVAEGRKPPSNDDSRTNLDYSQLSSGKLSTGNVSAEPKIAVPHKVGANTPPAVAKVLPSELAVDRPFYRGSQWLLEQPDASYTAQVLGSYNEKTAIGFVERNIAADKRLYYVESRYKDKPWFIVLYGSFPSKALARAAIDRASPQVKKQKPWLRSFGGIKDSLPN